MNQKEQESLNHDILYFFTRPHWRINKTIHKKYGMPTALWLAEILSRWYYWLDKGKLDKEGYFYITQEKIKEATGLGRTTQHKIIKRLQELKIIEVKRVGLPGRNWYKIDMIELINRTK